MIYLEKSQPSPTCLDQEKLKKSGAYNCGDVLERLKNDFKNKCYICEVKEPHSINIEHFKPHKNIYIGLKFDWNNLFYCCGHCNNTKLAKPEYDEILNCTIEADNVDTKIKYDMKPFPREEATIIPIENDPATINTVQLLDEVYNGKTVLKKMESSNIRSNLLSEIRKFQTLLIQYDDDGYEPDEIELIKEEIIRHLKPTSNFTAFKRWIIRENAWLYDEFKNHLG